MFLFSCFFLVKLRTVPSTVKPFVQTGMLFDGFLYEFETGTGGGNEVCAYL